MSTPSAVRPPRILLGQLYSNGDCLFATVIARQIKHDYPGCHLTWAISKSCRSVLRGNPHVDAVWEVTPPPLHEDAPNPAFDQGVRMWRQFKADAAGRAAGGEFDRVFLTQIGARTLHLYDGTVRSTIYRAYPGPITVPVTPVVRLDEGEIDNVRRFVAAHPALTRCTHRVLFECSPKSGQSAMTPDFALTAARSLREAWPDACFVLSSNIPIQSGDEHIIDGSGLTLRENAELTKNCTLLIGCSSGISWLCTSDWAKPLPMIQILSEKAVFPNSLVRDHRQWGLPTDQLLEMVDCPPGRLKDCLLAVFGEGFADARARYHRELCLDYSYACILGALLHKHLYCRAVRFALNNLRREGWRPALVFGPVRTFLFRPFARPRHWLRTRRHFRHPARPPAPS